MSDNQHHACGCSHEHSRQDNLTEKIALDPDPEGNIETVLRIAGMDCSEEEGNAPHCPRTRDSQLAEKLCGRIFLQDRSTRSSQM